MSRFRFYAAFLIAVVSGPVWAEELPPDEAPLDMRTVIVNGVEMRIHDFRKPNAGLPWLNETLRERHRAGSLKSCSFLVGVYVTRYEEAYGGVCVLDDGGKVSEVKICADTGVGNFNLAPLGSGAKSSESAAEFVAANCAGG